VKVLSEFCTQRQITKQFEIELDDNKVIHLTKWVSIIDEPGCSDYDGDWEFDSKEDKSLYEALPDEVQDEFHDFVTDLDL
jgi:hypothetical protein